LKNGDETEPFFFIHGLNGSIAVLNHIIDALKVDNAFYAFQAASNYGTYTSLEALATDYIAHIKAKNIQKCVLCGFSFGGILAFELAHQLKFAGIEVNLIQLDSKPFVVLKHQRKHYYKLLYGAKVLQWLIRGNSPTMLATENSHNQLNDSNILLRLKKIYTRIMGLKNGIFKSSIPSMPVNMYQKTLLKSS